MKCNSNTDITLLKGNEAIAHAAIRNGYDGFFGYPITPQSEILETLAIEKPWETTGMVVLQSESELASINMIYAGGASGKCVFTSSSSPGIALMQEGIAYMAACEIPGLIVSVQRGGPGTHGVQEVGQVYNMRLLCGGLNDGLARNQGCRQHDIYRRAYGGHVKADTAAVKAFLAGLQRHILFSFVLIHCTCPK